jgi:hypothetical protein
MVRIEAEPDPARKVARRRALAPLVREKSVEALSNRTCDQVPVAAAMTVRHPWFADASLCHDDGANE